MKKQKLYLLFTKNYFLKNYKTGLFSLLFLLLLANVALATGMSGTYTVRTSGGNYSTINSALSALKTNGVSGAVVIDIAKGTWSEKLSITSGISGVSSSNTVTFEGQGMFNTIISSSSTVISISSSTYINFRNLELTGSSSYTLDLGTGAEYINFIKCNIVNSNSSGTTVSNSSNKYCTYDSCYINGGYYNIYNNNSSDITIENCRITNFSYYDMYSTSCSTNIYNSNYLDSASASVYEAVYSYEENGAIYENNEIPCYSSSLYWYYGLFIGQPNSSSNSLPFIVMNNIIGPNFYGAGLYLYVASSYAINTKIYHNTIVGDSSSNTYNYSDMYIYQSGTGLDIRNNELVRTGPGFCLSLTTGTSGITYEDGNDFYNPGNYLVDINYGTYYNSISKYQASVASKGFAKHDLGWQPYFLSSTNFRCAKNVPEPFAPGIGVNKDIDGNLRCKVFPTIGASESTYGKGAFKTGIYGPDTAYVGSPAIFTSYVLTGSPVSFSWYVNKVFATDSSSLDTLLNIPGDSIMLIETGCAGIDTSLFYVVVDTPKAVPVANFAANYNTVIQGQDVQFYDLSTKGPSAWKWSITPDSTFDPALGYETATWQFINGTDTLSQNPEVQFVYSGNYTICLTATNARGKGNTYCQSNYITVTPAVSMCGQNLTNAISGTLYDDGGANGTINYGINCPLVIAPCGDTAFLVFDSFNMTCNNAWLQIFDAIGGHALKSNHATVGQPTNGFTSCNSSSSPIIGDTFISYTGRFYIVENTNTNLSSSWPLSSGFVANWWSRGTKFSKPAAKINSVFPANDSICVNGTMSFAADTANNPNATFLWSFDNNGVNGFSATGQNVTSSSFTVAGPDTIILVVNNCGGSDTTTRVINVFVPPIPKASFKANNTNPNTTNTVSFSPTQTMCIDYFRWTFTGPAGSTYSFQNSTNAASESPEVIFNDTGCWAVQLFEQNAGGSDSVFIPCYIFVKKPYCIPSVAAQIQDIGFNNVTFNTINNKTTDNRTGYNNFTTTDSTTLERGLTYTLTLNRATDYNAVDLTAWIDWNGDDVFTSGELVYFDTSSSGLSWKTNITVPKNAYTGSTVLRVAINKGGLGNAVCGTNKFGDYEDYTINIIPYNIAPVITLSGSDTVYLYLGSSYTEPGYNAYDSLDGNITGKVKITFNQTFSSKKADTFYAYYNVTDSSGLSAKTVTRVIIIKNITVPPTIGLCGSDTVNVEVDSSYIDKGVCTAYSPAFGNLIKNVTLSGKINIKLVGTYTLTYQVCDSTGNCSAAKRIVNVIDTVPPRIILTGHGTIHWVVNTPFTGDDSVTAIDAAGDTINFTINSNVNTSALGTYQVVYNATDAYGNKATPLILYVIIYGPAPTLTVNGSVTDTVEVNTKFDDPGVVATDNYDKSLKVKTSGSFISSFGSTYIPTRLGTFYLIYSATNSSNETTIITRTIVVIDNIPPVITLNGLNPINICRWQLYTDSGYTVSDNYSKLTGPNRITIDTVSDLNIDSNGLYIIYYIAKDSVGNISNSQKRILNVTQEGACFSGINNNKTLGDYINLYPNPSTGEFIIDLNLPANEQVLITVTNMMGQTIKQISGEMGNQKQMLDISGAADGIYFVNIYAGGQSIIRKVMVQH